MLDFIAESAPIGALSMMAAIVSSEIKIAGGSKQDVQKFFSHFDRPVDVGWINLLYKDNAMKKFYTIAMTVMFYCLLTVSAFAADDKPNILVIMGDDIGIPNIS